MLVAAAIVALPPSLAIWLVGNDLNPESTAAAQLMDWFAAWWLKLVAALVRLFAPGAAQGIDSFVSTSGRFPLAFTWILFSLYTTFSSSQTIRSVIERLLPGPPAFLDPRLSREGVSTINPWHPGEMFVGRSGEIAALEAFTDPARSFAWTSLVGRMGMGKTRLALEFMKSLQERGWDVGLLERGVAPSVLRSHRFRRPTLILIDDWAQREDSWNALRELAPRGDLKRPLRVLLSDQVAPRWPLTLEAEEIEAIAASQVLPSIEVAHLEAVEAEALAPGVEGVEPRPLLLKLGNDPWNELRKRALERLRLARETFGPEGARLLALASLAGPLDVAAAERLAPGTSDVGRLGLLFEGESRDRLRNEIPAVAPELLGQEILLQWYSDQTAVADETIVAAYALNPAAARERLRAMAAERPEIDRQMPAPTEPDQINSALNRLFELQPDTWRDLAIEDLDRAEEMSPDEAARMAITYVRLWPGAEEVVEKGAVAIARAVHPLGEQAEKEPPRVSELLSRAEHLVAVIAKLAETREQLQPTHAQTQACLATHHSAVAQAQDECGETPDWSGLRTALARLDALADTDGASQAVRLQCAGAYRNVTFSYGKVAEAQDARGETADWSRLRTALARLDALADADGATQDIRLECAKGHMGATISYGSAAEAQDARGEAPDLSGLCTALARLDALADAESVSEDVRLQCAKGHVNATVSRGSIAEAQDARGETPDWSGLRTALARLDALADADGSTQDIRLECAAGHRNATLYYGGVAKAQDARGESPDWSGLRTVLARLDALADTDGPTQNIRLECATGHMSATGSYCAVAEAQCARGEASDWSGLRTSLARLDVLADAAGATQDIRLECARGQMNATSSYVTVAQVRDARGEASDLTSLRTVLARLDILADAEGATQDILLECAKGHVNVTNFHGMVAQTRDARGKAPDWSGLCTTLARLDALADADGASREVRLECAKGYKNATLYYGRVAKAQDARGEAPDWSGLRAVLARLDALALADDNPEIRRNAIEAFSFAEGAFRGAKALADAETQRRRLKRIGWDHQMDFFVQQHLEQHYPHLTHKAQRLERERIQKEAEKFRAAR